MTNVFLGPREILIEIAKRASPGPFRAIMLSSKYYYSECKKLIPIWVNQWVRLTENKNQRAQIILGTGTVHGVCINLGKSISYYAQFGKVLMEIKPIKTSLPDKSFSICMDNINFKIGLNVTTNKYFIQNIISKKCSISIDEYEGPFMNFMPDQIKDIKHIYDLLSKKNIMEIIGRKFVFTLDLFDQKFFDMEIIISTIDKTISIVLDTSIYSEGSEYGENEPDELIFDYKKVPKRIKDFVIDQVGDDDVIKKLIDFTFGPGQKGKKGKNASSKKLETLPEGVLRV